MLSAPIKIISAIRKKDTLWLNNKNKQASESSSYELLFLCLLFVLGTCAGPARD
jgi:hypothetical protein